MKWKLPLAYGLMLFFLCAVVAAFSFVARHVTRPKPEPELRLTVEQQYRQGYALGQIMGAMPRHGSDTDMAFERGFYAGVSAALSNMNAQMDKLHSAVTNLEERLNRGTGTNK